MNNLPIDIHEIIYKKLPPKDRIKMRLVLPKTSSKIWNPKIERKLAVVNNYINKNKHHLKERTKLIPINIINFINENQNDSYIRDLGKEIDIVIHNNKNDEGKYQDFNKLLEDIKKNQVDNIFEYEFNNNLTLNENFSNLLIRNIYTYSDSTTFEKIYKHPDIKELFNVNPSVEPTCSGLIQDFCFGLINHRNQNLLDYIMTSGKYEWINIGKIYMSRPSICQIFAANSSQVQNMLKYFDLSLDSKLAILEKAEENIYEDTALLIQKYI